MNPLTSFRHSVVLAVVAALTSLSTAAVAATDTTGTLTFSDAAATQVPNWSNTLNLSQFDSRLGTLTGVTLSFVGNNTGTLAVENLASAGQLNLSGTASYSVNSTVWNFTGAATAMRSFNASGYDTVFDYGGSSGATFTNATGTYTASTTLTSDLEAFIGTGQLSFAVGVVGGSSYTGTGAAVVTFAQSADASMSITYHYTPTVPTATTVPEPQTYALFLAGVTVVGLASRRRRLTCAKTPG